MAVSDTSPTGSPPTAAGPVPEAAVAEKGPLAPRARGWGAWVAIAWLIAVAGGALLADVLPVRHYSSTDFGNIRSGLSFDLHALLGTDHLGRSVLSRVVYGARVSLVVGVAAVSLGMVVGGTIGMAAGYFRGWLDAVVGVVVDAVLAVPGLVLLLALTAVLGSNVRNLVIGLALLTVPTFARVARANTLVFAQRDFVLASRAMGATHRRILLRDLLPNVALPMGAYALIIVGVVIVAEGSLSFVGLGIPPPQPSWGGDIAAGRQYLRTSPHLVFVPAAAMFLTILSFNTIGARIQAKLNRRDGTA